MDDEILEQIMRVAKLFKGKRLVYMLENCIDFSSSSIKEELVKFIDMLEVKVKHKFYQFKDIENSFLFKEFIVKVNTGMTTEGIPTIILNDVPDGLQIKDNPILALELLYDDIEVRDMDFEEITLILK